MKTALLLIDVQQSFVRRPYWGTDDVPAFLAHSNQLVAGCLKRGVPVVRIFHTEGADNASNPFAPQSGLIWTYPTSADGLGFGLSKDRCRHGRGPASPFRPAADAHDRRLQRGPLTRRAPY